MQKEKRMLLTKRCNCMDPAGRFMRVLEIFIFLNTTTNNFINLSTYSNIRIEKTFFLPEIMNT